MSDTTLMKAFRILCVLIVFSLSRSFIALAAPEHHNNAAGANRAADKSIKIKPHEFTGDDIKFVSNGYNILYSALVQVLTENAGVPRDKAVSAVDAFVKYLAMSGEAAENRPEEMSVQDAEVALWDKNEFQNVLMKMLVPFDMDNPDKTKNLLRLSRDLNGLGQDPPEDKIRKTMLRYLSPETTEASIALINKGKTKKCGSLDYFNFHFRTGLNLNFSPENESCVSKEDIVNLVETHYGKKLPNLAAFIGGMEMWINDKNNSKKLIELGFAGLSLQKLIAASEADEQQKKKIEEHLEQTGINKGILLYIINSATSSK